MSQGTSSRCVVNIKTVKPLAVSVEQNVCFSGINPATGTVFMFSASYLQTVYKEAER